MNFALVTSRGLLRDCKNFVDLHFQVWQAATAILYHHVQSHHCRGKIAISSDAAESNLCTHQAECFQCSHTFYHYQYWMKYFFKTTQSINCVQKYRDVLHINCFEIQHERSGNSNCCFYLISTKLMIIFI